MTPSRRLSAQPSVAVFVLGVPGRFRGSELVERLSQQFSVHIVDGLDAAGPLDLSDSIDQQEARFWLPRDLSLGEIACAFGHRAMIEAAAAADVDIAVFVEDDLPSGTVFDDLIATPQLAGARPCIVLGAFTEASVLRSPSWNSRTAEASRSLSIPTCAMLYAMNRSSIENIATRWKSRRVGAVADYPAWYADEAKFFVLSKSLVPLLVHDNSLVGSERFRTPRSSWPRRICRATTLQWWLSGRNYSSLLSYCALVHGRIAAGLVLRFRASRVPDALDSVIRDSVVREIVNSDNVESSG